MSVDNQGLLYVGESGVDIRGVKQRRAKQHWASRLFCLVISCVAGHSVSVAATINGVIDTNSPWDISSSPYVIESDASINAGDTLVIEPGVLVLFNDGVTLTVRGALIAKGVPDQGITFSANTSSEAISWNGLVFEDEAVDARYAAGNYESGSILEHVIVEKVGLTTVNSSLAAIRFKDAYPAINAVTIRNNRASGIYVTGTTGHVKITNTIIENNQLVSDLLGFSAGIRVKGNSSAGDNLFVEIHDSMFSRNQLDTLSSTTNLQGGALHVNNAATLIVNNNEFLQNSANQGAAMYLVNMQLPINFVSLEYNYLEGNTSTSGGGGIYIDNAKTFIRNNILKNNSTVLKGGGVYIKNSSAEVIYNIFTGNTGLDSGGALFVDAIGQQIVVWENLLLGNHSDAHGGGIDIHEGNAQIIFNTLVSNTATQALAKESKLKADAIHLINAENEVKNNTITGRGASDTLYIDGSSSVVQTNTFVANSNVWFLIHTGTNAVPTISFNNVFGTSLSANATNTQADILNQNTGNILDLRLNWWGIGNPDPTLVPAGPVDFSSKLDDPNPAAPISPPVGIVASVIADGIQLRWDANPETDLAGYQVHWGTVSVTDPVLDIPSYQNTIDAGLVTEYTITNVNNGDYFVAVTAYDVDVEADLDTSIVNDRVSKGNESWFSQEQNVVVSNNTAQTSSGSGGGGGSLNAPLVLILVLLYQLSLRSRFLARFRAMPGKLSVSPVL